MHFIISKMRIFFHISTSLKLLCILQIDGVSIGSVFILVFHQKMQLTTDGILDLMGCKVSGSGDKNFSELARGIFLSSHLSLASISS